MPSNKLHVGPVLVVTPKAYPDPGILQNYAGVVNYIGSATTPKMS